MRSFALCSGSLGNCIYVESLEGVKILVDTGISYSKAKELLLEKDILIEEIDAIFITHEHHDHISGLDKFVKNTNAKIFLSKGTKNGLNFEIEEKRLEYLSHHKMIKFEDLNIFSINKPHDANEPLSYMFSDSNKKLGIFTDLGHVNDEIIHAMNTCDILYLEANYDLEYLKNQDHDLNFKYLNRLMSNVGHLGLHQTIDCIKKIYNKEKQIILSHISLNTTSYENIYYKVNQVVDSMLNIHISFQGEPTNWFE